MMKRLPGSILFCFVVAVAGVAHFGCGSGQVPVLQNGSDADGGGGGEGGSSGVDAASDAAGDATPPVDGASFACGTETCGAAQYCLNPCCGGAPPQCIQQPAGGACPVGFHPASCNGDPQACESDPCKPPPARCVDDPVKDGVGCMIQGRQLLCVCG